MTLITAEHLAAIHRERHARRRLENTAADAEAVARELRETIGRWVAAATAGDPISASAAGIAVVSLMPGKAVLWSTWASAHAEWASASWELEAATLEAASSPIEVSALLAEFNECDGYATGAESMADALDRFVREMEALPQETHDRLLDLHREAFEYQGEVYGIWRELRRCGGWEQLAGIVPPEACRVIFSRLLVHPAEYERNRQGEIAQHQVARRQARALRSEISRTEASPGLSVGERGLLLELLDRIEKRGADNPGSLVNEMPDRPGRETATRTFTIRLVARELSKYTDGPLHAAIARLTEAALHLPARTLAGEVIQSALKDWKRPAWAAAETQN